LQNSAEEFESHDGLSVCVGIDAWNEFFEALDSELERAQSSPVNQQMLEALKELRDAYQEFMGVQAVKANAAISAAEASGQENHQAEPVAGQCKFSFESVWRPCSVEHHYHVLSCQEEWPGYETRLLYTAPQPSSPPGWKLVPVEPTSKMIVAGAEADPQFFTHAQFVYRAMLAAVPEQEGGAE
ncbi:hypothetical protein LH427_14795, partial [Laribacter hongkongensis]